LIFNFTEKIKKTCNFLHFCFNVGSKGKSNFLSAISYQLSAISYQLSAISYQPMCCAYEPLQVSENNIALSKVSELQ